MARRVLVAAIHPMTEESNSKLLKVPDTSIRSVTSIDREQLPDQLLTSQMRFGSQATISSLEGANKEVSTPVTTSTEESSFSHTPSNSLSSGEYARPPTASAISAMQSMVAVPACAFYSESSRLQGMKTAAAATAANSEFMMMRGSDDAPISFGQAFDANEEQEFGFLDDEAITDRGEESDIPSVGTSKYRSTTSQNKKLGALNTPPRSIAPQQGPPIVDVFKLLSPASAAGETSTGNSAGTTPTGGQTTPVVASSLQTAESNSSVGSSVGPQQQQQQQRVLYSAIGSLEEASGSYQWKKPSAARYEFPATGLLGPLQTTAAGPTSITRGRFLSPGTHAHRPQEDDPWKKRQANQNNTRLTMKQSTLSAKMTALEEQASSTTVAATAVSAGTARHDDGSLKTRAVITTISSRASAGSVIDGEQQTSSTTAVSTVSTEYTSSEERHTTPPISNVHEAALQQSKTKSSLRPSIRSGKDKPRSSSSDNKKVTIAVDPKKMGGRHKKKGDRNKGPVEMFRPSSDAYTPRMGKKDLKYKPAAMRTPVQQMASPLGTLSRPNFRDALRRVAMIIHQHIVKIERRFEQKIVRHGDGLFSQSMKDAFSEESFVTPKYKCSMVRVPMARPGVVFGLKRIQQVYEIPSEGEIFEFAERLFSAVQLSSECSIVCLIYMERLMEQAQVPLMACTWRPIFMCGLLLASKVWQDLSSWNIEFATVYPQYSLDSINRLELQFLRMVKWDLYISSSLYAKYYFALRSLVEKPDFRNRYNRMVAGVNSVRASQARKVEERSTQFKEEVLSQLSRSM